MASVFVTIHQSVVKMSQRMIREVKRWNYVTPTNYLELVSGYKKCILFSSSFSLTLLSTPFRLLNNKFKELGDAADKLRNGLSKLIDTRQKVEIMTVEMGEAKVKVTEFQKQCDEYLIIIVKQKRDAEEQEKVRDHFIVRCA